MPTQGEYLPVSPLSIRISFYNRVFSLVRMCNSLIGRTISAFIGR